MLSSSAGLHSHRVLLCTLPPWYVAFRMKPLEQATQAISLLAGEQPELVAEAGGMAVMLQLVRRSREGSPRCSSVSSREFAAEVLKDVPALVAHMLREDSKIILASMREIEEIEQTATH